MSRIRVRSLLFAGGLVAFAQALPADENFRGRPAHRDTANLDQAAIEAAPDTELDTLRRLGLWVFSTPFNSLDGFGDGPYDSTESPNVAPGNRPTLQGNGTLLRVNGLDAQSCNECHSLVRASTQPPTLGIGGVGGVVQNAIIMPSLIDVGDTVGDDRVQYAAGHTPDLPLQSDGTADFNGRFANPPFLFGGGGVELLAKEMTIDLQQHLSHARLAAAGTVTALDTHGVNFGSITTLDASGNVELSLEGVGPEDYASKSPEEVLVVRPFGRKGEAFSMRDFDRGAMQFHFGIQPVEVIGADVDGDGDNISNEVTVAEMSVLHIFDVTNPKPVMKPLGDGARAGFDTFRSVGCASCHRPVMKTRSKRVPLASPEMPEDPERFVYKRIDLTRAGFDLDPNGAGVLVPLFADLKRHKMGPRLAETFERGDIANDEFTTARLWGVADTAPYLHDGRATTLYQAIEMHGGEAQPVRDAFMALPDDSKSNVIRFLKKLRTPRAPNTELFSHD